MDGSISAWTESDYSKESIKLCVNKIKESLPKAIAPQIPPKSKAKSI